MTDLAGSGSGGADGREPAAPSELDRLDLLVVLGTDHHAFERLVGWVDEWVRSQGADYRALVQHGSTPAPTAARGRELLAHDELLRLMSLARVVVMHGGPASIIETRRLGKLPVVVPRVSARGEHVDDHQVRFTRRLAELGLVALCETADDFVTTMASAQRDPARLHVDSSDDELGGSAATARSVAAVRTIIDELAARRRRTPLVRRVRRGQ